jgi:four helix bundle protein
MGSGTLESDARTISQAKKASRARSDSEFCSKLDGLLQEADESQLWLELLRDDCAINNERIGQLHGETDELLAIFTTIVAKTRKVSPGS